jgi:hypothetical protein
VAGLGAGLTQPAVRSLLTLGHLVALDLGDGLLGGGVGDGQDGADVSGVALGLALSGEGGLGGLDFLSGGVQLLELAALAGEEDEAGLVVLQTGDVGDEGLLGVVDPTVVDGDADGGGELLGDTSFLIDCKTPFIDCPSIVVNTFSSARVKPRPARTRRLYLTVGHRTTGRSLSTGRGATAAALARRASRRRCLRPGYRKFSQSAFHEKIFPLSLYR